MGLFKANRFVVTSTTAIKILEIHTGVHTSDNYYNNKIKCQTITINRNIHTFGIGNRN